MKTIFFAAGVSLAFFSAQKVQATTTEISFNPEVSRGGYRLAAMWEPVTIFSQDVPDRFLPDSVAAAGEDSEEYYFWWWDISPDTLTNSHIPHGEPQHRRNTRITRQDWAESDWLDSKALALRNGRSVEESNRTFPNSGSKDTASWPVVDDQIYNKDSRREVEILVDAGDDRFSAGLPEHPFIGRVKELADSGQDDSGHAFPPGALIFDPLLPLHEDEGVFDNKLFLRFTEVASRPAKILEPGSSSLLLLGLMGLIWLRVRRG